MMDTNLFFDYFCWLLPFITLDLSVICGVILGIRLFLFKKDKRKAS